MKTLNGTTCLIEDGENLEAYCWWLHRSSTTAVTRYLLTYLLTCTHLLTYMHLSTYLLTYLLTHQLIWCGERLLTSSYSRHLLDPKEFWHGVESLSLRLIERVLVLEVVKATDRLLWADTRHARTLGIERVTELDHLHHKRLQQTRICYSCRYCNRSFYFGLNYITILSDRER